MPETSINYEEYRGISDVVIAPLVKNTATELTYGTVIPLAGIAELTRETETSQESHYYDNQAALVVSGEGADTVKMKVSALGLDRLAQISGRYYDETKDMYVETPRAIKYFAVGYKTGITGDSGEHDRYVWRYMCQFDLPSEAYKTKDNSATAEGQEVTMTCIYTKKRFTIDGEKKPLKALVVADTGKADLSTFFDQVTFPEDVKAVTNNPAG